MNKWLLTPFVPPTPTTPADWPIRYEMVLKASAGGVLDKAGNDWDMKKDTETETGWENKGTVKFSVSSTGEAGVDSEEYVEEE